MKELYTTLIKMWLTVVLTHIEILLVMMLYYSYQEGCFMYGLILLGVPMTFPLIAWYYLWL